VTARLALALALAVAAPVRAETLRIAAWDVGLARDGAGVLLHDLGRPDAAIAAVAEVIRAVRPDILLLNGFDDDRGGRALDAFRALLAQGPEGVDYPHAFHAQVNAGEPSFRDLDGDGRATGWGDAWGWGKFPGHGGMALLSGLPLDSSAARTFRLLPWSELPGALLTDRSFRLSSRSHWDVTVPLPDGRRLHLLASNPTPPLFGPEGRNERRNHDEIAFWSAYLGGAPFRDDAGVTASLPEGPTIVLGNLNADPVDGRGLHAGIGALLAHPRLQDPRPASAGAAAAANPDHAGLPALDTADWRDEEGGPGNLRTDYVLPSRDLAVAGSGVFWPAPGEHLAEEAATASPHRLVWVDLALP
jgi:hypothetical protein